MKRFAAWRVTEDIEHVPDAHPVSRVRIGSHQNVAARSCYWNNLGAWPAAVPHARRNEKVQGVGGCGMSAKFYVWWNSRLELVCAMNAHLLQCYSRRHTSRRLDIHSPASGYLYAPVGPGLRSSRTLRGP